MANTSAVLTLVATSAIGRYPPERGERLLAGHRLERHSNVEHAVGAGTRALERPAAQLDHEDAPHARVFAQQLGRRDAHAFANHDRAGLFHERAESVEAEVGVEDVGA